MRYEIEEIIKFVKIYNEIEMEANNFLFISYYPMKVSAYLCEVKQGIIAINSEVNSEFIEGKLKLTS